jgi:hypothetical protein
MMAKKKTRLEELQDYAKEHKLYVATWSPGDGTTRYRFFDKPGNSYFGPGSGIYTALGIKDAWNYLYGGSYYKPKSSHAAKANHATKKKIDHHEAKRQLKADGVDFRQDFHALPSYEVQRLADFVKMTGYRKRKDAPGSTIRMYYQYLSRLP